MRILKDRISEDIKHYLVEICSKYGYELVTIEIDKDPIHLLINYDATDCISEIVKRIKQETTYKIWLIHVEMLCKHYWKRKIFWPDGYFACSIGEVSTATIQRYIVTQG